VRVVGIDGEVRHALVKVGAAGAVKGRARRRGVDEALDAGGAAGGEQAAGPDDVDLERERLGRLKVRRGGMEDAGRAGRLERGLEAVGVGDVDLGEALAAGVDALDEVERVHGGVRMPLEQGADERAADETFAAGLRARRAGVSMRRVSA
jgi:hypothetical protein